MQEVLAASGQTQQVSFLNAISRSEKSCNACAQPKVLACHVSASQALQAQHTFIFGSTCRVTVSPILVCHVPWLLHGQPAPLDTFSQAVVVPVPEDFACFKAGLGLADRLS